MHSELLSAANATEESYLPPRDSTPILGNLLPPHSTPDPYSHHLLPGSSAALNVEREPSAC